MRLFVAVWPSPEVVERLAAIERPAHPGVRWSTADQWHVTLRFLGEVSAEELEAVKGALVPLASLCGDAPVRATAGPGLERLGPTVLSVAVAGLDSVAAAVVSLTGSLGDPVERRPFRGHLTLARAGRGASFGTSVAVPFVASWDVDEVTLVASTLRPTGARYQVIGRYPLSCQ